MKFEIKHNYSGNILFSIETTSWRSAVEAAIKSNAYLRGADLREAYLRGADGINKFLTTPLYVLLDQTGKIRAYKLVTHNFIGPYHGGITYRVGQDYAVGDADCSETIQCAKGINLAMLDWCINEWKFGYHIMIAEFEAKDIAAIPIGSDGKFRVHRCAIVGEKDLVELGLAKEAVE